MKTMAEYQMAWRRKDPVKNRQMQKRYYSTKKGKASMLACSAKQRARKRGLPCQITQKWVMDRLEKGVCEVTGLPFDISAGNGRSAFSPSLHRKNSKRGYTYRNTQVVVWVHNAACNDWPLDDVITYAKALIRKAS